MAEIDIYKRKLFGGLTQPEFQEIVDYSKSFGGIPSLNVNRGVTTQDVLTATTPLSQPIGPGATNAVAAFNDFLSNILTNRSQRVTQEKQAYDTANEKAMDRVQNVIADVNKEKDLKDRYMEVDGNLIDLEALSEGKQSSDYIKYKKATETNLKDQYVVVDDQLVDLLAEGGPDVVIESVDKEKNTDRFKIIGNKVIDLDILSGNPDNVSDAVIYDGTAPNDAQRYAELVQLKEEYKNKNEPFPVELEAELSYLTPKETKPYESKEQQLFAEKKFEVVSSSEAAETQFQTILDAEKLLTDPNFVTGTGTSVITPVQEFFGRFFGLDIDELLNNVNIDVLNDPSDTASLQKATSQLAMNVLGTGKLPGAISDFEFKQMMFSVFNVDSPKEANLRFLQGMKYLYEKDIAKGRIISTISSNDPQALLKYQEALQNWDDENRPKYLPSPTYLNEILERKPG